MEAPLTVEFVLEAQAKGRKVTPSGIPFSLFKEFNSEVEEFILGSEKPRTLTEIEVSVHESSYLLRVLIPIGVLGSLANDVRLLQDPAALAEIDKSRARVVERWQARVRDDDSKCITIRTPGATIASIRVDARSDFRRVDQDQWIPAEHYLVGEITDWGGAGDVNMHLRLRDTQKIVKIDMTVSQIREQERNLVRHRAVVQVRGEKNPRTGEWQKLKLISMRPLAPKVSSAEMERFIAKGAKIWADVPSGATWVEEQRGNIAHG
jgi:hypothetical protein